MVCSGRLVYKGTYLPDTSENITNVLYLHFREGINRTGYLAGAQLATVAEETATHQLNGIKSCSHEIKP